MKINKKIVIKTSLDTHFFRYWLEFLRPVHKLTNNGIAVLAAFLKKRYELSKEINNQELLNKTLMSIETKKEIKQELAMTDSNFYMILCTLRKNKMVVNGEINKNIIPNIEESDNGEFSLVVLFNVNE